MLAKHQRCFREKEIALTFKKGKKMPATCFLCRYLSTDKAKKALVVVSKKVSKSAVKRNHFRRIFHQILASEWERLPSGLWYFSLRSGFDCTAELIHNDLNQIISHNAKTST